MLVKMDVVASAEKSIVEFTISDDIGDEAAAASVSPSLVVVLLIVLRVLVYVVMSLFRLLDISMYERYGVTRIRESVNRFGGLDNCDKIANVAWWLSGLVSMKLFSGSVPFPSVEVPLSHLFSSVDVVLKEVQFPLVRSTMPQVDLHCIDT